MVNPNSLVPGEDQRSSGMRRREILIVQPGASASVTTYEDLLKQAVDDYKSASVGLVDTVDGIGTLALELVGANASLSDPKKISKALLEKAEEQVVRGLENSSFSLDTHIHNNRIRRALVESGPTNSSMGFSNVLASWSFKINNKLSISCHDLEEMADIVNAVKMPEEKKKFLKMTMILSALSQSKATMTNAMNNLVFEMETVLKSYSPEDLKKDPLLMSTYLMFAGEYLKLSAYGAISSASLSKSVCEKIEKMISSLAPDLLENIDTQKQDSSTSAYGALANLIKVSLMMQIKAKSGLRSGIASRSLLSLAFKNLAIEASKRENRSTAVSTNLVALALSTTSLSMETSATKLRALRLSEDRVQKLSSVVYPCIIALRNAVDVKVSEMFNGEQEKTGSEQSVRSMHKYNAISHKSDMYLIEARYESLVDVITTEANAMIKKHEFELLSKHLKTLASLRNQICETDGMGARQRDIYGISDRALQGVMNSLLTKLADNNLSLSQNKEIVKSICCLIKNMYAKHRNRETISKFISVNLSAIGSLREVLALLPKMNNRARYAAQELPMTLYEELSSFENSDITTMPQTFFSSSPELLKIIVRNQMIDLKEAIASNNMQTIMNIQHHVLANTSVYLNEFIFGKSEDDTLRATHEFLTSVGFNFNNVAQSPLAIAASVTLLRAIIISAVGDGRRFGPSKQLLVSKLSDQILESLQSLTRAMSSPSQDTTHRLGIKENSLQHIRNSLVSMLGDEAAKDFHAGPSMIGLMYLGSLLVGNFDVAQKYKQKFEKGIEHQGHQKCVSSLDLEETSRLILGETEEAYGP